VATDDLLFVLDRLAPVHAVVGHSYGALVALEAARRATSEQIPRRAAAVGGRGRRLRVQPDDAAGLRRAGRAGTVARAALETCIRLDDAEPYRKIDVPTLLLLGNLSAEHPFRTSIDALHDVLPDSQLAFLDGQGHLAVLFAPSLIADELRRFLTVG
jgi:pimeloyl-ACP methyl ester carboxylesterase